MDYSSLTGQEFELLCERLLKVSGYKIQRQEARSKDVGVDFVLKEENGALWVVEVKHFNRPRVGTPLLRQAVAQLRATREFLSADKALLIISMTLPEQLKDELTQRDKISVWDARELRYLIESHPEIERDFMALIEAKRTARRGIDETDLLDERARELISNLESLPPGRLNWREFEEICVEILNYSLIPPFGVPIIQSRSEDGLDIRDAVYPIGSEITFWDDLKRICMTRFAVAEFKNHSESITQKEVESVQQYLYRKAMRMFGIVCSRKEPSESAIRARRRAWVETDKLIVLLSDEDLKDLIRARSFGENPAAVIDAQLEEFFLYLAP
ncbi:MAG TPA: restriction endonuclease [Syntrophales bacterium]|nr:restriction endonuclease [Syntrophales bacterium]